MTTKAQLIERAETLGLEIEPGASKADIQEAIDVWVNEQEPTVQRSERRFIDPFAPVAMSERRFYTDPHDDTVRVFDPEAPATPDGSATPVTG